jgi:hypothetical protein
VGVVWVGGGPVARPQSFSRTPACARPILKRDWRAPERSSVPCGVGTMTTPSREGSEACCPRADGTARDDIHVLLPYQNHIGCSSESWFTEPSPCAPRTRCSCHPSSYPCERALSKACHQAPPPLSQANWPDTPPPSRCAARSAPPVPPVSLSAIQPGQHTHTQVGTKERMHARRCILVTSSVTSLITYTAPPLSVVGGSSVVSEGCKVYTALCHLLCVQW